MNNINGVILLDKPTGISSHDAVNMLRKIVGTKRVGHTGTLDPLATGVLPMCIGSATKAAELLTCENKEYTAEMVLGMTTDTGDCEGNVLTECGFSLTEEQIRRAAESFVGSISQLPPMYSAKKVGGKKLYELARDGITVERKPENITIHELTVTDIDMEYFMVSFHVRCSKGTYIRVLCEDIGRKLGCGAYMNKLRRTASGAFKISDCKTIEEIKAAAESGALGELVIPTDTLFDYKKIILSDKQTARFANGVFVSHPDIADGEFYRVYGSDKKFMALAACSGGRLRIKKSFMSQGGYA